MREAALALFTLAATMVVLWTRHPERGNNRMYAAIFALAVGVAILL